MNKISKQPISKIQRQLWVECKRIIREKYLKKRCKNTWVCFTCNREVRGVNCQTGHFIPKGACGAYLKYDLRNLRIQCYHCNINLGGNGAEFYKRMVKKEGQDYVDKLFQDKNVTVKAYDHYVDLLIKYKKI